jgi:radical SAM protein with 4Fe4S-binding SPASM domain
MTEVHPLSELSVEITWQCLQDCVHCSSIASKHSKEALTKDEIVSIARDFKNLGGERIELSGGEPLLHKNIAEILPILKSLGLEVNIFTCGAIVRGTEYETPMHKMVQLLKQNKVDKVVFSLHGANARTHDDIARSQDSFSHAVKFIRELVKEKRKVGIHFVPMAMNFEEFRDLVEFAKGLGIHDVSVLRFVPQGRGRKNRKSLSLNKAEVARLVELLTIEEKRQDILVKAGSHLDFTFLLDGAPPKQCNAGIGKCLIEANGNVLPCAVFKGMTDKDKNNFVAGNIRKNSLSDIWAHSEIFDKFRKFDPNSLLGACKICDYLSICRGRCPAQRIYDHGDFYVGPDNYCPKEVFQKHQPLSNEQ